MTGAGLERVHKPIFNIVGRIMIGRIFLSHFRFEKNIGPLAGQLKIRSIEYLL